jgi:antibiotic biosynthesis monooxygenase
MDQLQATATFPSIAKEDLAEFKRIAGELRDITATEPGALQYDWFFNADETQCVVRETYASSEAVLEHLGHVGELLGTMVQLGGGLELDVFGDPSEELSQAIASLNPVVYTHFQSK